MEKREFESPHLHQFKTMKENVVYYQKGVGKTLYLSMRRGDMEYYIQNPYGRAIYGDIAFRESFIFTVIGQANRKDSDYLKRCAKYGRLLPYKTDLSIWKTFIKYDTLR